MAYSNFYNPYAQNPYQMPSFTGTPFQMSGHTAPAQPTNLINWVQGETGAKAFPVAPNTTVQLMDSEKERFYIKSVDASGMPLPLRIFDFKEVTPQSDSSPAVEYATKKELEELRLMLDRLDDLLSMKQERKDA